MQEYLFDLHVHTKETSPCGRIPAKELVHLYKEAGYAGIVITDHFSEYGLPVFYKANWELAVEHYHRGYEKARQEGSRVGLTVLWGLELTFNGIDRNDYLVYGVDDLFLLSHKNLIKLDLQNFRKLTAGSDAVICQAHPYRPGLHPASPQLLDGMEVYNGNARHNSSNHKARAYAEQHTLLMISGSDTHQPEDVGRGGLYLPMLPATSKELALLLKKSAAFRLHETP